MLQLEVHFKSSMHIDISELATRSGVPASTLRHYETLGLIAPVGRAGLRRVYERARIFDQLAFIELGQRAGFSLAAIAALGMQVDRQQLAAQADALDRQIQHLGKLRDMLRHTANCPQPTHWDCPKFQQLLRTAAKAKKRRLPEPAPPPR